ncbi:hypothetical protein MEQU1_000545 [Malassezia equina]|uniref:Inner nuclear membrane protein SRC1 n=1 Tax=Malassezia equina TaxID=1381935 RepID=A0AAF0EFT2_9BASI|nr:hypothetical protein MEQU1_000545 [Malassezia equina]
MDVDAQVNAASLRVVDLRRILQAHQVPVPSTARKAALIDAFEKHVRPALLGAATSGTALPVKDERHQGDDALDVKLTSNASVPATPQPPPMDIRFSDDNPFQKDSVSPPSAKRASKGTPPMATRTSKGGTTPPHVPSTPSPSLPKTPGSHVRRRTPQQARQLAMRSEREPAMAAIPVKDTPAPTRTLRWTVLRWVLWAGVLLWFWHCWQTRQAGYCTSGTVPIHEPHRMPRDLWKAIVSPACVPCPEHSVCHDGRLTGCASTDYVKAEPWQARVPFLAQALPLSLRSARCVPDTFKLVLASELADALIGYLAHWHGQVRCQRADAFPQTPHHALGLYAVPEARVKEALLSRITASMDTPTFEAIWALALEGLQTHAPDEMLVLTHKSTRYLVATHASMPLRCRLQLFVREWAWRNRLRGVGAFTVLLALWLAYQRRQRRRKQERQVAFYAREVFQRLQTQAAQAERDSTPREIPVLHLRDTVLESEARPAVRQRLWAPVARVVQQNANVRSRQAQWHGEWQHVWEWMGTLPSTPSRDPAPSPPAHDAATSHARPSTPAAST